MGVETLRRAGHIRYFTPSGLRPELRQGLRLDEQGLRPDEKVWHCSVYFIYFSSDTVIEFCMRQSKIFSDVKWEVLLSIKSLNEILEVF
jgi:hypothetical protein